MRLRLVKEPFDNPDYIFELKHDGFRALAYIDAGECRPVSRNLKSLRFESLRSALGLAGSSLTLGYARRRMYQGACRCPASLVWQYFQGNYFSGFNQRGSYVFGSPLNFLGGSS